jgi:hypothetical protein
VSLRISGLAVSSPGSTTLVVLFNSLMDLMPVTRVPCGLATAYNGHGTVDEGQWPDYLHPMPS